MKKIIMLLIVVLILVSSFQTAMAYTYYIDILEHWGEPYIEWATNDVDLFKGYKDGTFKPDNSITRAEFMSILNRLLQIQKLNNTNVATKFYLDYDDLSKNFWAYDDIYELAYYLENKARRKVDLKSIFPGNNFGPNDPITRYEAGVLTSLITPPPIKVLNKSYKDLTSDMSFYREIMELTSNGIVKGYNDGTFRPWQKITRAEAATIIKNAYGELEYLKNNELRMRDLKKFNLNKKKPLFEYGANNINQPDLDKNFINAITTLDYLSFVGYIPYSERHLYDPNPIDSLWQLKNDNYYNVIGVNYYLLYYDKNLVQERKIELIKEAFEHYESINKVNNVDGVVELVKIAKNIVSPKELILFLEKYFYSTKDNNDKILAGTLLVEQYLNNYQYKKALEIHKEMLHLGKDIELRSHLILNNGYLIYKNSGTKVAIDYLNKSWNDLKTDSQYRIYKDEGDFLFTSMIKQLMMK